MRKTHAANSKRIKQNSTSLVKWFKSTKMKCLENVNMGVIRRCFLRRIGWRAHTAILHKRKLFKSFSYGSTPYTPTISPIKEYRNTKIVCFVQLNVAKRYYERLIHWRSCMASLYGATRIISSVGRAFRS